MDDELAVLMVKAGCEGISFGVESGDEDVLRDSDKAVTLDDIRHGVSVCHNAGLPVYGGFIIGHPSDTVCSVVNSMLFSVSSGLDYAGFGLMMPFPGTRVREQALLDGGIVSFKEEPSIGGIDSNFASFELCCGRDLACYRRSFQFKCLGHMYGTTILGIYRGVSI
jgi:hypothetical protein